jgi:hypothetical protein
LGFTDTIAVEVIPMSDGETDCVDGHPFRDVLGPVQGGRVDRDGGHRS